MPVLNVFTDVVLPVFAIAALGGLVGRWRQVDVRSLTSMVFYLFSPALVFDSLATSQLTAGMGARIFAVIGSVWVVMLVLAQAWARRRRFDPSMRAGFVLAMTSANAGNMGLPVAKLAFGEAGLQVAVLNFVASALIANSLGIVLASSADRDRRAALQAPLRYPVLYAAALGLVVRAFDVDLPLAVSSPIGTLAGAAIPAMLVVLGLQLGTSGEHIATTDVTAVVCGRLLLAPVAGWAVATAVGLNGVERGTMVVLAAMPVAVVTTILAAEFRARVDFVARVVAVSTVVSIPTLTVLISLVR